MYLRKHVLLTQQVSPTCSPFKCSQFEESDVMRLQLQPLCTTVSTEVTHYTAYYAER